MRNEIPECINDETEHDWKYVLGSTDSRQEWTERTDKCANCGRLRIQRTEYNQIGLVTLDKYYYLEGERRK